MVDWLNTVSGHFQYQSKTHCYDVWYTIHAYKWRCFNRKTDEVLYGECDTHEEAQAASLASANQLK